ncbi:MAG: triose-phosphate isomerase [Burkholderiaceae bacterium]|nr:triose-phosphate isomerase [Burkholderiaceae bacterium]
MSDTSKPANAPSVPGAAPAAPSDGRSGARQPLVIGNWKMNGDLSGNERLLGALRAQLDRALLDRVGVAVCPPYPFISQAATWLGDTGAQWGAQDVASQENGAFTGEVSARMLADLRCVWTLVGHSERRRLFGDTDEVVAQKAGRALEHGIRPVVCLGEELQERQAGITEEVLGRQLDAVLPVLAGRGPADYALAYEPVWAIGTGLTASPEQAQAAHAFLRARLAGGGAADADKVRILYGGSVKAANAIDLFEQQDVDGGLIGGASLVADEFVAICKAAAVAASARAQGR